jgi:hypothetical protein
VGWGGPFTAVVSGYIGVVVVCVTHTLVRKSQGDYHSPSDLLL